ncbi:MAG: hypothetical protein ABEJ04_04140, partial [Halobacteriaceae archaeon]
MTLGRPRVGRALDLRDCGVSGRTLAAAARDPDDARVECDPPGPVHRRAGHVRPETALSLPRALAAAARSRGLSAPQDDELVSVRER